MQYFKRNGVTYRFKVFPEVYPPSDDSFLLAENFEVKRNMSVLDMGTGCGIQGIVASNEGAAVTACDLNKKALYCAKYNAELNGVEIKLVLSDLFSSIEGLFDVILFNPPYLISDSQEPTDLLKKAWDGGAGGREVIDRFLFEVEDYLSKNGRIFLVQSSLNDLARTLSLIKEKGFNATVKAEKKLFFERLYLLDIFK
jgi:release factor glutamine methyltransferase